MPTRGVRGLVSVVAAALSCAWLPAPAGAAAAPAGSSAFTSSSVTAPGNDTELFYDADSGSGSITVEGTVSPAISATGDVLCYSQPKTYTLAQGVAVNNGAFGIDVSLKPVAGQACRLIFVPSGQLPTGTALQSFTGPAISVSVQASHSTNGSLYDYYVLSGTPTWAFDFGSLGRCPVENSDLTDQSDFGSYTLFAGNACLAAASGIPPNQNTRSALQVDGLNAYPPGAIPSLTGAPGFQPLSYTTTWDANHDTVTIADTETLMICAPPGGYPPSSSNCPSLTESGVQVQQMTQLLPGAQVVRVSQQFSDTDGKPHTLDLLFGQSIEPFSSSQVPGFEFPGQSVFATHKAPDSFSLFPSGPGTIYVVADAATPPSTTNPVGAITYGQPPQQVDFVSGSGAQKATMVMRYVVDLAASGSDTFNWSFAQASGPDSLTPLVMMERDRFFTPTLRISKPRNRSTAVNSPLLVSGLAYDPVGVTSVTVDGHGVPLNPGGAFTTAVRLRRGANTITVSAVNEAGNHVSVTRLVTYRPGPCVVPRLAGRTLAGAQAALLAHGCGLGRVRRVRSPTVRRGRVIASVPARGTRHRHGTRVRLLVSRGRR